MTETILCCGILQDEMSYIMQGQNIEIRYIDPGLHVNLDDLEKTVIEELGKTDSGSTPLIIGSQCHPDMLTIVNKQGGRIIKAKNCIEMLLGEKLAELDAESNNFYLTSGWLKNWRKIFIEGLKWDTIDARQNFGFYDRVLLLDTGITPIDEEEIIEFFDYTQVPVENIQVDLCNLRQLVSSLLEEVRQ